MEYVGGFAGTAQKGAAHLPCISFNDNFSGLRHCPSKQSVESEFL